MGHMTFDDIISTSNLKKLFYSSIRSSGTRGIDFISPITFEARLEKEIRIIQTKSRAQTYKFTFYREKLVNKGAGRPPRVLSIPTVRDRLLLLALKEYLQITFPECINRDLPNKKVADIFQYIQQHPGIAYLKTDIKGFYDHLDPHLLFQLLKKKIKDERILSLLWKAIHTPTVPQNFNSKTTPKQQADRGIPQGLSVSNILAEIYMSDFDQTLGAHFPLYSRYVDDILICTEGTLQACKREVKDFLKQKKLSWNLSKTSCGKQIREIVYLGYLLSPQKITVPEEKIARFIRRIAGIFTELKKQYLQPEYCPAYYKDKPEALKDYFLEEINKKITGVKYGKKRYGWICYYSQLTDITLLSRMDHIITAFFNQSEIFAYQKPNRLKSIVRAHYELRKGKNSYLFDYNSINTLEKKRTELIRHNLIREEHPYTAEMLERLYTKFLAKSLYSYERDSDIMNGKNSG